MLSYLPSSSSSTSSNASCDLSKCQTQAEAHYKGHKHARKLKALESQRSRQKGGRGPHRAANKERGGRAAPGAEPPATDSHLKDPTGTNQSFVSTSLPKPLPLLLLWVINGNLTDTSTEPWPPPSHWVITGYFFSCHHWLCQTGQTLPPCEPRRLIRPCVQYLAPTTG